MAETGGMIALVPADPSRLTVKGGDPAGEMHLTLVFLGDDVTSWPAARARRLDRLTAGLARLHNPVRGDVFGHAVFNPDSDRFDPAAVYMVNGNYGIRGKALEIARHVAGDDLPEQHPTFIPHVTAGYQLPLSRLRYTGPLVFDRLRLALGDTVRDYRLGRDVKLANEHSSRAHPDIPEKPGDDDNWVDEQGGLPPYMKRVAKHIMADSGYSKSHAIASAVSVTKKRAAKGNKAAIRAVAQWKRMRARANAD